MPSGAGYEGRIRTACRLPHLGVYNDTETWALNMTLFEFIMEHLSYKAENPPNFLLWVRSVLGAMVFLGPDTDADLERLTKELLGYHSGADIPGVRIDSIRKEIVQLRGGQFWSDESVLGLKYRCLNAIATSRETSMADIGEWEYGVVTAFDIINMHHDKDQFLIEFVREQARDQGVDLRG